MINYPCYNFPYLLFICVPHLSAYSEFFHLSVLFSHLNTSFRPLEENRFPGVVGKEKPLLLFWERNLNRKWFCEFLYQLWLMSFFLKKNHSTCFPLEYVYFYVSMRVVQTIKYLITSLCWVISNFIFLWSDFAKIKISLYWSGYNIVTNQNERRRKKYLIKYHYIGQFYWSVYNIVTNQNEIWRKELFNKISLYWSVYNIVTNQNWIVRKKLIKYH